MDGPCRLPPDGLHHLSQSGADLTDKKENPIFLMYKEIQNGSVAKSDKTNGLLIYGEIFAHFFTY
jgi:hypothetical protein